MEHNVNEPYDKEKGLKGGKPDEAKIVLVHSAPRADTEGSIGDRTHEVDNRAKREQRE
jgi:hypothetical protein